MSIYKRSWLTDTNTLKLVIKRHFGVRHRSASLTYSIIIFISRNVFIKNLRWWRNQKLKVQCSCSKGNRINKCLKMSKTSVRLTTVLILTVSIFMFLQIYYVILSSKCQVDFNLKIPYKFKSALHLKLDPIKVIEDDDDHTTRSRLKEFKLEMYNNSYPLVFLHVGKAGGMSFDGTMHPLIRSLRGHYLGFRHFDWSYVETVANPQVVMLLRDPVDRVVSHFYFARRFGKQLEDVDVSNMTLHEYLHNPKAMLITRTFWNDGQGGVYWLTGTHTENWWVDGIPDSQIPQREAQSLRHGDMCMLAAKRLESLFWFGLLEKQQQSLELLRHQLGLKRAIVLRKGNANAHPKASKEERTLIEQLIPKDIWLYKYAQRLFQARWKFYNTGLYVKPKLPTLPNINCYSTRFILHCKKKPLGPLFFNISSKH